jgi:transcriptional regulator with XRE-family HTH domain
LFLKEKRKITMTLGQKIKQLRTNKEMSQPELAQQIGIEQSYLSKLENDKAFPSDELFNHILTTFEIEFKTFINQFEPDYIKQNLSKLNIVKNTLQHYQSQSMKYMLRWIWVSSLLIVLGATALVSGQKEWIYNPEITQTYSYESLGIVKDDEPLRIFATHKREMADDILARLDFHTMEFKDSQGSYFVTEVDGGKRFYSLSHKQNYDIDETFNNWLSILGLFAMLSGVIGLCIEHKIRQVKRQFSLSI